MAERRDKRHGDERISNRFLYFFGLVQENHAEALAGGAAFVLKDQLLTNFQEGHLYRSYSTYDPDAGREFRQNQMETALNFACTTMGKVETIEKITRSNRWKKTPDFHFPAFEQALN